MLPFLFKARHDDAQLLALEARMDAHFYLTIAMLAMMAVLLVLLVWKMDTRLGMMETRLGKVEKNQTWMMITSPERVDFWNSRTKNDPAPTPKPQNLARKAAAHYECGAGGDPKLCCALTGLSGDSSKVSKHQVVVAHLLRRNNPDFAFAHFGLDPTSDRDGMRNVMLLCKGLEEAFDEKRISFFREDDGKYRMQVWDKQVRLKQIWRGEQGHVKTIGDCDNEQLFLNFPEKKTPYTRILSYHHRVCFYNAKMCNWIDENQVVPADYGSPFKGTVPLEIAINSELDSHFGDQLTPNKHSADLTLVSSGLTGDATDSAEKGRE